MNRPRPPHVAPSDPVAGRVLGRYRLLRVLGEGGMGVVYMAEDQSLGRTVALKCIRPGLARNRSFLRRFRTEARALARINSPAIVTIHSLSEVDGRLLIDMEYVDGPTLKERIEADGALAPAVAVPIMRQLLRAFDDAHRAGVIHRDVKPQNILLPSNGGVKITDFGLARVHTDADETVTRGIAGTLKYMSPEQVQSSTDLDARSDLFSLGITFYEMLTGQLPYDDGLQDYQVMRTIVEQDAPSMRRVRTSVPKALDQIVMRALRRDPDQRYQDAAEMLHDLDQYVAHSETAIPDPTSADETEAVDRSGWARWTVALGVLLLAGIGVWWWATPAAGDDDGGPSAPPPATLTVRTTPPDAQVVLDDRPIGSATGFALSDGTHAIRVERAGFLPFDTTLTVAAPTPVDLDVALVEQATLAVASEPRGAAIFVDGTRVGATGTSDASELFVAPGERTVRLTLEGYRPYETTVSAQPGEALDLRTVRMERIAPEPPVDDDPEPEPPVEGPTATLRLNTVEGGGAWVDGRAVSASGVVEVEPGVRSLRFTHPEYGVFTTTVRVDEDDDRTLTAYFEHPITVLTSGPWGNVWINGVNYSNTPFSARLGPGTYDVELRIDRSNRFVIDGGRYTQFAGTPDATTSTFRGASMRIVVEPSLREEPRTLAFDVRSGSTY